MLQTAVCFLKLVFGHRLYVLQGVKLLAFVINDNGKQLVQPSRSNIALFTKLNYFVTNRFILYRFQ